MFRVFCTLVVFSIGGVQIASGQTHSSSDAPAEVPPASYSGKQYVDSRGCVFVRAGFDGNVVWLPRVTRTRELLCGFAPTNTASAAPTVTATTVLVVQPEKVAASAPQKTVMRIGTVQTSVAPAPSPSSFRSPRGFKIAWDDGRLNTNRGPRTEIGNIQMNMVWTQTVPRRLMIDE